MEFNLSREVKLSKIEAVFRKHIQHYDHEKYWKLRDRVVDPEYRASKIRKLIWLHYIKKCDAFNNSSMGTHLGYGAAFSAPPHFPHGMYGIIVSHEARIGKNCTLMHQITIGNGKGGRR